MPPSAERFDAARGFYEGLIYAKAAPEILSPGGLLVRADLPKQQAAVIAAPNAEPAPGASSRPMPAGSGCDATVTGSAPTPAKPRRFFGSVEIDMNRPVKAFDAIISAVVMELQRSPGAKVKLTWKSKPKPPSAFNDTEVGAMRGSMKPLRFTPGSTGFQGCRAEPPDVLETKATPATLEKSHSPTGGVRQRSRRSAHFCGGLGVRGRK